MVEVDQRVGRARHRHAHAAPLELGAQLERHGERDILFVYPARELQPRVAGVGAAVARVDGHVVTGTQSVGEASTLFGTGRGAGGAGHDRRTGRELRQGGRERRVGPRAPRGVGQHIGDEGQWHEDRVVPSARCRGKVAQRGPILHDGRPHQEAVARAPRRERDPIASFDGACQGRRERGERHQRPLADDLRQRHAHGATRRVDLQSGRWRADEQQREGAAQERGAIHWRPFHEAARAISRVAICFLRVSRLSCAFLPRARASWILARPPRK